MNETFEPTLAAARARIAAVRPAAPVLFSSYAYGQPVALVANFFRVLILILLTYHAGEAAAQGFLHNFAGIAMFAIALLTIFAADEVLKPLWDRLRGTSEKSHDHD